MTPMRKWGRLPDFEAVLRRFPVATLAVASLTLLFILDVGEWNIYEGWPLGFILGAYLAVGVQLASESRAVSPRWLVLAKIFLVAGSVTLAVASEPLAFYPWLAVLAAVVFLGNFAWWGRARFDEGVWLFTQRLWTGAIFTAVGSAIYAAGISVIFATLDMLFGFDLGAVSYRTLLSLGLAFLAPVYWMGSLPHPRESKRLASGSGMALSFEARALAFLGTWLLAPLVIVYGLIIVAYALRVLLAWSVPDGQTAWLVTPFLAVGTFTWLVLQPKLCTGPVVRLFYRIWFPVALISAVLLAVAVWMRVAEFSLTPGRNLLIAFTLAALILGMWFTFSRPTSPKWDIRIPTAVAAGFLLASSFLAKPVADIAQLQRLKLALANSDKSAVASTIQSAAAYLGGFRGQRESWLRELFPDVGEDVASFTEWEDYVRSLGYVDEDEDWAERRRDWDYTLDMPADVSDVPVLLGSYDIYHIGSEYDDPYGFGTASWFGNTLRFPLDGETISVTTGRLAASTLFADNEAAPTESLTVATELPDGRAALLIFTRLELFGRGATLNGGQGRVLVFSE